MDRLQPELSLCIAGVRLALRNRTGLTVPPLDSPYLPFVCDARSSAAADLGIDVALVPKDLSDCPPLTRTHSLGPECSFYRDAEGRLYLRQPSADDASPVWFARFDRTARDAVVLIERSRMRAESGERLVTNPLTCGLDQALLVYRLAALAGGMLHGAVAVVEGKGLLLAGRSGSGKSTLARLLARRESVRVLSDERAAVRRMGDGWTVHGTPWCSSAGAAACTAAPLCGLFFLRHGSKTEARALSTAAALERLLPLVTIPWGDPLILPSLLDFCGALSTGVAAFDMPFEPHERAADHLESLAAGLSSR